MSVLYDFKIVDGVLVKCKNSIKQALLSDEVVEIGEDAFNGISTLTSIRFPDELTVINENAFANCYTLCDIIFPDTLTKIGDGAFANCPCLTDEIIEKIKLFNPNALK